MGTNLTDAAMTESQYIHGTTPAEQDRLSRLNDLLNDMSLREMKLVGNERVIDVGCGLGQLTRAFGRQVTPRGSTLGIERSMEQLAQARRLAAQAKEDSLVEFREGAADKLSLRAEEWGSFDVAHARFLLEHVTDPLGVVREMVRSVRPGGRIILEDDPHDTHRLWPEPAGFGQLWSAYMRTYDRLGCDPVVGHRLVSLLAQAGAIPRRIQWLFFGACAGQPELLAAYTDNLVRILDGARQPILKLGEFEQTSFDECLQAIRVWGQRPDAAYWYAFSWAEGVRPES